MTRRPRVLVVGPGPRSAGGVWSAISTMLSSPLADRFEMTHIATHRDGPAIAKLGQAIRGIGRVAVTLARGGVDLAWVHTSADASFRRKAVVAGLCRLTRTPFVLHSHGSDMANYHRDASGPERAVIRRVLRSADLVVALGPTWERILQDMTPCVTVSVMNPVDVPDAPSPGAGGDGPVVSVGRLGERKGSRVLVRAVALLAADGSPVRLVLAGDGDQGPVRDEAAALGVGDRVRLTGWVSPDDVAGILDGAAVFALPSRDEGLPIALLEAMARGVPCVVTPVGGIPDLVTDGETGVFVRPDDPEGLAEALGGLLADPDRARRIGDAGRREVIERCSTPVVAAAMGRCFSRVLTGEVRRARRRRRVLWPAD